MIVSKTRIRTEYNNFIQHNSHANAILKVSEKLGVHLDCVAILLAEAAFKKYDEMIAKRISK